MVETALTAAQQSFAAERHGLVYSFLRWKNLDESDFYDVVVFGYLKAVKEYLSNLALSQKYQFSTIAFKAMRTELHKYYEYLNRQKRKAYPISFDTMIYGNGEVLSLQEVVSVPDSSMMDFDTELLMLELASKVSKRDMDVIRMKAEGYGTRDIAKAQKMPMKGVVELLASLRDTVLAVCYE